MAPTRMGTILMFWPSKTLRMSGRVRHMRGKRPKVRERVKVCIICLVGAGGNEQGSSISMECSSSSVSKVMSVNMRLALSCSMAAQPTQPKFSGARVCV